MAVILSVKNVAKSVIDITNWLGFMHTAYHKTSDRSPGFYQYK